MRNFKNEIHQKTYSVNGPTGWRDRWGDRRYDQVGVEKPEIYNLRGFELVTWRKEKLVTSNGTPNVGKHTEIVSRQSTTEGFHIQVRPVTWSITLWLKTESIWWLRVTNIRLFDDLESPVYVVFKYRTKASDSVSKEQPSTETWTNKPQDPRKAGCQDGRGKSLGDSYPFLEPRSMSTPEVSTRTYTVYYEHEWKITDLESVFGSEWRSSGPVCRSDLEYFLHTVCRVRIIWVHVLNIIWRGFLSRKGLRRGSVIHWWVKTVNEFGTVVGLSWQKEGEGCRSGHSLDDYDDGSLI